MLQPALHVLLIANDQERTLLRRLLEADRRQRYAFSEVATGAAGIAVCRTLCPDLVLLAWRLPDGSGSTWLHRLYDGNRLPSFPVLLLGGAADRAACEEVVGVGVLEFVSFRRLSRTSLARAVGRALERQRRLRDFCATEARFRRAIVQAPAPILILANDGEILEVSEALLSLTGYTRAMIPSTADWLRLAYGERADDMAALIAQHFRDGRRISGIETPTRTHDGDWRHWVLTAAAPEQLADGRRYIVMMANDITELRQAEQTSARLAAIVETTSDIIIANLADGRILDFNRAGRQQLGWAEDADLSSGQFTDCFAATSQTLITHVVLPKAAHDGLWAGETLMQARDGRQIAVSQVTVAHRDAAGQVQYFSTIARDISARKRFEHALEEAWEAASAANRAKSEFLANASHDIRTPMAAIIGYADVLLAHLSDPDDRQCAATIKQNSLYLIDILNDILDLSKIEAGRLEVVSETFSLLTLVNDVVDLMQVRAATLGLQLQVEYGSLLPERISSDRLRLRQVLLNLLGNAFKFTAQGEVRLKLTWLPDPYRPLLQFQVSDTGIGMTRQQIRKLFKPFAQVRSAALNRQEGTGLGLAISQRLVELLGGTIDVESNPGAGSTFTFTIAPELAADVQWITPQAEVMLAETASPAAAGERLRGQVLVADDRRDSRFLVQHYLEEAGADVVTVQNGQAALEAVARTQAERQPFDLIIMDMHMPVLDGFAATAQLRAAGFTRPIVALTANAMHGEREHCLNAGCDDYLSKPVDGQRLVALVARYLKNAAVPPLVVADAKPKARTGAAGCRVLLVEDSVDTGNALRMLLELYGHTVQIATSGQAALRAAEHFRPEVVLCDLGLPDMRGEDVVARLRVVPTLGDTLFIALSGRSEDESGWRKAGFHHYVMKPADWQVLQALFPKK